MSLENEIRAFFHRYGIHYRDETSSRFSLDFSYTSPVGYSFTIEAKEKRKPYTPGHWPPVGIPERDMFILDDLSVRKVLAAGWNSGIIVRDTPGRRYVFLSQLDLAYTTKHRVNRPLYTGGDKGKVIVSMRDGTGAGSLSDVFRIIKAYALDPEREASPVYKRYRGENVGRGGTVRTPDQFFEDYDATR